MGAKIPSLHPWPGHEKQYDGPPAPRPEPGISGSVIVAFSAGLMVGLVAGVVAMSLVAS